MPLNLASPGIVVREVDLTVGRVDPTSASIGAIVAPFAQGPVDLPTLVENEQDLLRVFGKPYSNDKHYEHWLTASSFLAYGGSLRVVRADDADMYNAKGVSAGSSIKVKSVEHYEQLGYDETPFTTQTVFANTPGSWANGIRVGVIDARGDQILTMNTAAVTTFNAAITDRIATSTGAGTTIGITTTSITLGQVVRSGVVASGTTVTDIGTGVITLSNSTTNTAADTFLFDFGTETVTSSALVPGAGVTQAISKVLPGAGTTTLLDGYLKGIITEVGSGEATVKVLEHVAANGTVTEVDYQPSGVYAFGNGTVAIHTSGKNTSYGSTAVTAQKDWFDAQTITLSIGNTTSWNQFSDRPGTSEYAAARGGRFDEVHVVVIDGNGTITGNAGTILEKHLSLSKAKDAEFSVGSVSYWTQYLKSNSEYVFGGTPASGDSVNTGFKSGGSGFDPETDIDWNQDAEGITFKSVGNKLFTLTNGKDYNGISTVTSDNALNADLGKLVSGYGLFENTENYEVDFLLMGSGARSQNETQALANKLIAVAEARKDAIAFISPNRTTAIADNPGDTEVAVYDDATITNNVLEFFAPITSSSYAVFDSGYKYMYDRFANTFRYVPLNGDIAGLCARNDINNFPWFSPAGTARGAILNAVKLAYNPSKVQRDRLYSARVNPVIFSPGSGIILFGDKTGFAKASAFDRINVRRLFVYLEDAISAAAKDQLFEFNDEITRTNFVNIVEPFLRDVQAKRGIQDYVVICDETNNTAAVIDNNEFIADIYIKPARSINFIGLTFVATRTGVAFEEVIGNV